MTERAAVLPVDLDRVPPATFRHMVVYLDDVLRECQLVLVSQSQGRAVSTELADIASGLVPDIEEIGDAFRAAEITERDDGTLHLSGALTANQASLLAGMQVRLVQVRQLGRRGALLLDSDPQVIQLMEWVWEELADQLRGRRPRPYQHAR
ncbi:MAG: hypothetical protein JWO77_2944 [Ilumatobacteraceae bacterium]|nr:hypothetical protein [Ilumatobacteraceae bacterium]